LQVPPDAIHAILRRALERSHDLACCVGDLDLGFAFNTAAEPVVDRRAGGWVVAVGLVVRHRVGFRDGSEAIGGPRLEKVRAALRDLRRELLQWGDVVEDPESPPVRSDDQIVEVLLHHKTVHGRVR